MYELQEKKTKRIINPKKKKRSLINSFGNILTTLFLFCMCDNFYFYFYLNLPSDISLSRISQANIVGFSRLYCSIFETTAGVATFGLLPPIKPGGLNVPEN